MGRQRDLELIIGSLEMRIATMKTLWQEGGTPRCVCRVGGFVRALQGV